MPVLGLLAVSVASRSSPPPTPSAETQPMTSVALNTCPSGGTARIKKPQRNSNSVLLGDSGAEQRVIVMVELVEWDSIEVVTIALKGADVAISDVENAKLLPLQHAALHENGVSAAGQDYTLAAFVLASEQGDAYGASRAGGYPGEISSEGPVGGKFQFIASSPATGLCCIELAARLYVAPPR